VIIVGQTAFQGLLYRTTEQREFCQQITSTLNELYVVRLHEELLPLKYSNLFCLSR